MTDTTATRSTTPSSAPSSATGARPTTSGLRSLHLLRAAVSLGWVALLLATSSSLSGSDTPTVVAAVLLVAYPWWDVAATVLERRVAGTGSVTSTWSRWLGVVAGLAMLVAAFTTVTSILVVFGAWALLSGALQLAVAVGRRRAVGAQWPMMVSGALSVLAGATIAATSATAGLSTVAGYSAFGAFWFLVSAAALTLRARRATR